MKTPDLKGRQFRPGDLVRFNPAHIARCPSLDGVRFRVTSAERINRNGLQLVRGFTVGDERAIASLNSHLWMLSLAPLA